MTTVDWALQIIQREIGNGTTGEVRIQLHEGVIQRAKVEKTEKAPVREKPIGPVGRELKG